MSKLTGAVLEMIRYLIYDCEIRKLIPDRNASNDPRFDYCGGWGDHANMGISVIGTINQDGNEMAIVPDDDYNHVDIIALEEQKALLIGFNSANFDDKLCQAHGINIHTDYDILEEVRIAAGFAADFRSVPKGYSYKLDAIVRANGMAKTGHGELAPMLWQQGKRQEVIDYCLNDVRITRSILELGLKGELKDPNTGKMLKLKSLDLVPF
jgi:hypothetical protein